VENGTDPTSQDADGDGVTDSTDNCPFDYNPGQENTYGGPSGDACETDPDPDRDGLSTIDETETWATDPNNPDSDGDGLTDGNEVNTQHTDPNNPDSDGDTLTDGDEVNNRHTNPTKADTDGDGFRDDVDAHPLDPMAH
jgi:hypothetical protein